jgi:hypothetical protein
MRTVVKARLFFALSLFGGAATVYYVHWSKEYARKRMKIAVEQDKLRLAEYARTHKNDAEISKRQK